MIHQEKSGDPEENTRTKKSRRQFFKHEYAPGRTPVGCFRKGGIGRTLSLWKNMPVLKKRSGGLAISLSAAWVVPLLKMF
jgi:hypothetical protein